MDFEGTDCVLCRTDVAEEVAVLRDRAFPGDEEFRVVRCRSCGLHYLSPRPTPAAIARYYPDEYGCFLSCAPDRPPFSPAPWKRRLKELVLALHLGYSEFPTGPRLLRPLVWLITAPLAWRFRDLLRAQGDRRLLDVGCGTGNALSMHAAFGWRTWGVEMHPPTAETARRRGHEVFTGTLEQADYADGFFDVVMFHHSLEHVHAPDAALAEAFRVLKPGGRLLVALPNAGGLPRRLFRGAWYPWDPPRHLWHFDARTLGQLLRRTGFRIIGLRTPSPALILWRSLMVALHPGQPNRLVAAEPRPFAWLTWPLRKAMEMLRLGDDLNVWAVRDPSDAARVSATPSRSSSLASKRRTSQGKTSMAPCSA